ncbi:hypothetical protein CDJ04_07180 [Salmonella enterica]|uniref:Class I SAM-dependent methyltransferase n=4 Tax=Salmonella enterica TaxID=28901 RepID=A0A633DGC1_SALER|nr:hypothetical protein [Salmonella enterica]EBS0794939.1 hypothetical protein [Salmonella enterica subsp. enterica serovar Overschie]EBW2600824.1 hypothetical protein [Salmonella enterica subsp. enterica serovar Poano]EBZ5136780.1 hypothetical protein [Salmonella enterica subsp. enterica serovar Antsalova]ECD6161589.1 hypothetical protein [Salmonella enterica subsp. enterica]ECU7994242.1 hypothetical protein [Salmonella enterica subsp. enterica serovar Toucra]EDX5411644.1 class I SAM-depende
MTISGLQFVNGVDEEQHLGGNIAEGDPRTYAPSVWDYVIKRFAVKSVLDIGSGLGYAADYFFNAGVKTLAVEGLTFNVNHSIYPALHQDITQKPILCKVDLVHCQEVVEHIEESFLDNLLSSLTCGRFILMTHAVPGQEGHHHVNEQPMEYWINHLRRYSCGLLEEDTMRIRHLAANDGALYLAQNGLLFVNRNRI